MDSSEITSELHGVPQLTPVMSTAKTARKRLARANSRCVDVQSVDFSPWSGWRESRRVRRE